ASPSTAKGQMICLYFHRHAIFDCFSTNKAIFCPSSIETLTLFAHTPPNGTGCSYFPDFFLASPGFPA
ncbi:MAG: hypothetical protein IJT88_04515, partial [Kiritimatiellae bacterium]|nr:hypothetical protein [Kiritimatiellia bacterium]